MAHSVALTSVSLAGHQLTLLGGVVVRASDLWFCQFVPLLNVYPMQALHTVCVPQLYRWI